tara:strand:+ start:1227 stop:1763 length:537 start_codon:yes stop_codon:yes gene_type:complete
VLRRVGLTVAALGGGSGLIFGLGHGGRYRDVEPACELLFLQRREYTIVAALAETMFPAGVGLGISGIEARVPEYIDRWLEGQGEAKAGEFRMMLMLFEHGTAAFGLRVRRFSDLPMEARERYLRRWETTRLYSRRMLAMALKSAIGIAYFAHPEVKERLGIRHRCATPADADSRAEWQ